MRKGLYSLIVLALVMPALAFGQGTVFTVKMGPALQTAQIGLPMGNLQPYIGLDYFSISASADLGDLGGDLEASGSLLMPHIGAKLFLSANEVKPYVFGNFFKSFASVKVEADGEDMLGDEATDMIKDLLGFWGIKVGFGAEYSVNEKFSIGGEWGLNMLFAGAKIEADAADLGLDLDTDIKASLKNSYIAFVLNFHL